MIIKRICEDFFDDEQIDIEMNDSDVTKVDDVYTMPTQYSSYEQMKSDYTFGMILFYNINAIEETEDERNKFLYAITKTLDRNLDKCNSITEHSGYYQLSEYNAAIEFGSFPIQDGSYMNGNKKRWFIPLLFCFNGNFRRYSDVVVFKKLINMTENVSKDNKAEITQVQFFRNDASEDKFDNRMYWHNKSIPYRGETPAHLNALYERKVCNLLCGKDMYKDILKYIGFEITYDSVVEDFKKRNKGKTVRTLSLPFHYTTLREMQDYKDVHKLHLIPRNENYEIPYNYQYDYNRNEKDAIINEYNEQHPDEKVIMLCMFTKRGTDMIIEFIFTYQNPILFENFGYMFITFQKMFNIHTYGNIAQLKFILRKYFGVDDFKKILDEILKLNNSSSKPIKLIPNLTQLKKNNFGVDVPDVITDELLDSIIDARPDLFK